MHQDPFARHVRVSLSGPPGLRHNSLLGVLEGTGCLTLCDPADPSVDVALVHPDGLAAAAEVRRRLLGSPSVPVIVVTAGGDMLVYERHRTARASAIDLIATIVRVTTSIAPGVPVRTPPGGTHFITPMDES